MEPSRRPEPDRGRRLLAAALAAASPLLLAASLTTAAWGALLFAALAGAFPVALMALGAWRTGGDLRRGRPDTLGAVFLVLLVLLEVCLFSLLALRGGVASAPWVGGLPLAAAVLLYGLCLAPLALVGLAHALTFHRWGLGPADLERLRRLREERERAAPAAGGEP